MKRKAREVSESDWSKVFDLRCRSKRGEHLSPEDRALLLAAYKVDATRYAAMSDDVFVATAPFGSTVRR